MNFVKAAIPGTTCVHLCVCTIIQPWLFVAYFESIDSIRFILAFILLFMLYSILHVYMHITCRLLWSWITVTYCSWPTTKKYSPMPTNCSYKIYTSQTYYIIL